MEASLIIRSRRPYGRHEMGVSDVRVTCLEHPLSIHHILVIIRFDTGCISQGLILLPIAVSDESLPIKKLAHGSV
jgi:hypothetical protein